MQIIGLRESLALYKSFNTLWTATSHPPQAILLPNEKYQRFWQIAGLKFTQELLNAAFELYMYCKCSGTLPVWK
jgi:hypothetical protein